VDGGELAFGACERWRENVFQNGPAGDTGAWEAGWGFFVMLVSNTVWGRGFWAGARKEER